MGTPLFNRILVGWDGSHGAVAGLKLGLKLTAFSGGHLTALSVTPTFGHVEGDAERAQALADARAPLQSAFEQALAAASQLVDQSTTLEFAEDSQVAETIDRYVANKLVDLLIVGLHGREGILHPRMGHIANHVVRASCCPVLVIPAREPGAGLRLDDTGFGGTLRALFPHNRHHVAST